MFKIKCTCHLSFWMVIIYHMTCPFVMIIKHQHMINHILILYDQLPSFVDIVVVCQCCNFLFFYLFIFYFFLNGYKINVISMLYNKQQLVCSPIKITEQFRLNLNICRVVHNSSYSKHIEMIFCYSPGSPRYDCSIISLLYIHWSQLVPYWESTK